MSSRVLSSAVVYHHPTILELPELLSQLWALWHGGFQLSLPGKQQHPFGQFHSRRQKDLHGSFADVGAPVLCLPVPLVQLGLLLQWLVGLIAAALLCQYAATVQGWAEQTALLADQWLVAQALWLVTAEPAGIKLHAEACHLLGWFMLNCLRLWSIASIWAWPVCAPVSGMIVVLGLVSGGLAGGLAACHDLLLLAAAPLALLHLAFSSLLRVHRMSIGRTWQMMRGQGQPRRRTPAAPPKPNPDPNHHPTAGVVYRLLANSESVHTVPSPSATYGPGASPCMPGNAGKSEAVDSGESSARHANQRIRQHGVHQNEEGGKTAAAVGKTAGQRNSSKQLADHRNPAQDAPKQWQRGDAACGMAKQGRLASNGVVAQVTAAATANKQVSHSHSMATQQLPRSHAAATHQLARAAQQSKVGATSQDLHSLWGQPDKARDEEVVVERLIVGVLLFVPLLALAPSTFAWHLLATTAHLGSVLVRAVIRTGVRLQLVNPALILLWWVGRPHDFLDVDAVQPLQPPPRPSFSRQLHARGISRSAARKVGKSGRAQAGIGVGEHSSEHLHADVQTAQACDQDMCMRDPISFEDLVGRLIVSVMGQDVGMSDFGQGVLLFVCDLLNGHPSQVSSTQTTSNGNLI